MDPARPVGLQGEAEGGRRLRVEERRVVDHARRRAAAPGDEAVVVPPPDALLLEARGGERQAAALLQPAVRLHLDEVGRGHLDQPAVERPPAERVRQVLPAQLEAEGAVRQVAPLQVAEHHVDRRDLQAWDVAAPPRHAVVGLPAGLAGRERGVDAEVGVDAHHHHEAVVRLPGHVGPLQVVHAEPDGLEHAPPLQGHVAPRAHDVVALQRGVALHLELGGPGARARQGGGHHRARREGRRGAHGIACSPGTERRVQPLP